MNQGWIRRLAGYVLRHRLNVAIALAAALLGSAGQAVVPLIARQIVDEVIIARTSALWPWLVALVGIALLIFGLAYLRRYRGGQLALDVQYDLRNAMHDHLLTMDQATLAAMPTGQLVSRANSDSTLVQGLLGFLPILSGNVLLMLTSLAVMLYLSPVLAVVSLLVLPALFAVSYRMRRLVFPASWDAQQREGDVAQLVDEAVNGVRVVKAFGQERRELERVADAATVLYGARMRTVRLRAAYQPLLETIPVLGQVAILALGGWLALHGRLSIGTFLAFSTYVAQFVAPARQLAGILTIGQQARAGVERIFALLDLRPQIADPPDAVDPGELRGEIEFRGVSFGYADGPTVLHGIDLQLMAGERVAVVGPSGSGKSTLTALLCRFHDPSAGSVLIDGQDVRRMRLHSLRRQIGVAFEDSFLFSASVRENIAYGRPDATDDAVTAAAWAAEAHEFITALPDGYATAVGERGLTLSGGQRQRIALARAILTDPRVLVLDDATSAVDARTEEAIHENLRGVLSGRTTILIAHRVSTLHLADRIVVLGDEGRIVAEGTFEQLSASSAHFRALVSGLQQDVEVQAAAPALDGAGITAAAWRPAPDGRRTRTTSIGAPALGPGLGRGGGGGWQANLAPTPELLARVDALPPIRDAVRVDLAREGRPAHTFTLPGLLREFRRPLLLGLVLVVLDALAGLAGPVLVKTGIDNGVVAGSTGVLFAASGAFLAISLADLVNQVAETFVTGRVAERAMLSLRVRIWAQLQRLSLDYYEREMAGRIMTRMTTDVDQFESLIENGLLNALVAIVTFVGVGVTLLVVDLELALCTLAVVVPLAAATVWFRRRAARLYELSRERIAIVNADFQESLSGVREAQAFAHEAATRARFHRLGARYVRSRVAAQRLVATYFPFVQFLSSVADAIVLGVGAHLIATGSLTPGALIAFILYIDMFFSPIQQLSQVFDAWQQTRVSVGRVAELMALRTLTPEAPDARAVGQLRGELALRDVHFAYPAAPVRSAQRRGPADVHLPVVRVAPAPPPEALRGVDVGVGAGETVALVGETGAGKSTVVKLLARFYDPGSGAVTVDGTDLRALDVHGFRSRLGYVPQESFLFSGTVRDNISYGRPDASDAEVEAAARAVGAHEFVAALPGGYLHHLVERGRSLSSGQRQLLALARAELVDPAVLLLDEATSNLDLATEQHVAAAMQHVARSRTTVLIAHRLQTARGADRIVVLDHGRIVETGPHAQLLAADGRYAAMWRAFESAGAPTATRSRRPATGRSGIG